MKILFYILNSNNDAKFLLILVVPARWFGKGPILIPGLLLGTTLRYYLKRPF